MFRQVTLANFKSIRDEASLELGDLTVITGANSSGKSTVIQAMLLLGQTIRYSGADRQLVLNGPLVRLGEFRDALNTECGEPTIGIGIQVAPPTKPDASGAPNLLRRAQVPELINARWRFGDRPVADDLELQDATTFPTVDDVEIESFFEGKDRDRLVPNRIHIRRHAWRPESRFAREGYQHEPGSIMRSLSWRVDLDPSIHPHRDGKRVDVRGAVFDHFLPKSLSVRTDVLQVIAEIAISRLLGRADAAQSLDEIDLAAGTFWDLLKEFVLMPASTPPPESLSEAATLGDVKAWVETLGRADRRRLTSQLRESRDRILRKYSSMHSPSFFLTTQPLPDELMSSTQALRDELSSIRYLGPLRVQPAPLYPIGNTLGSEDVGPSGEWTAAVLDTYRSRPVSYPPPSAIGSPTANLKLATAPLIEAVDEWLQYLDVSRGVHAADRGSLGHELTVSSLTSSRELPLTHVGVGVSQCLPVVVSLLLARPNTITLLEQPELHLHPAVQSRLADFLLAMSSTGRQCVVETHSEYLVNRLRLRTAEDAGGEVHSRLRIYFAEIRDARTHFEEVELNEYGAIANWPRGFFDSGQDDVERILRASARKRARGRSARDS